jgi:hypothetical protein
MSSVQDIENAISKLSPEEIRQVRDWLENLLEDRLEFTDEFKAQIAEAKANFAKGESGRVRNPS